LTDNFSLISSRETTFFLGQEISPKMYRNKGTVTIVECFWSFSQIIWVRQPNLISLKKMLTFSEQKSP